MGLRLVAWSGVELPEKGYTFGYSWLWVSGLIESSS